MMGDLGISEYCYSFSYGRAYSFKEKKCKI